jgi:hypothetical protein
MDIFPDKSSIPAVPSGTEPSNKYIRTFAGDMETLKKGGMPDLKPLVPSAPVPAKEVVKAPEPLPAKPPAPKEPPPLPVKPPPPPLPSREPPAPARPSEPLLVHTPEPSKPFPLETYANDFLQKIKKTHASTVTVLAAEQDAGTPQKVSEGPSRSSVISVVAGVTLLLLGVAGAYIGYTRYLTKIQPIVLAPAVFTPIFVDEKEKISGTDATTMTQAINESMTRTLASNAVRLLYTEVSTTTDTNIFSVLKLPAPGVFLRNVNADQSIVGIVNTGGTPSLFFILSVASYPNTFSGMLSWEPKMPSDLSAFFPPYPASIAPVIVVATTTATTTAKTKKATTTPSLPPPPPALSFHDELLNNHDVRIYRDAEGRSVLVYGYWNNATLVIARDPGAFTELLSRLATYHTQ